MIKGFFEGAITIQKLKQMGRVYREYREVINQELEQACALFDKEEHQPWDDLQADGLWALVHWVQLNPDYWRAKSWAESVKHTRTEIAGMIQFTEHALSRALNAYDKRQMIELMGMWVYTWSQHVNDLIEAWKLALKSD